MCPLGESEGKLVLSAEIADKIRTHGLAFDEYDVESVDRRFACELHRSWISPSPATGGGHVDHTDTGHADLLPNGRIAGVP